MTGYLYIIESLKNGQFYIGSSTDVAKRLKMHNSGRVKATRHKRPYTIKFVQKFEDVHVAQKHERRLKNLKRKDYLEKIVAGGRLKYTGP